MFSSLYLTPLARAFARQADLAILDEPTSAMEAWAEAAAWRWQMGETDAGNGHEPAAAAAEVAR